MNGWIGVVTVLLVLAELVTVIVYRPRLHQVLENWDPADAREESSHQTAEGYRGPHVQDPGYRFVYRDAKAKNPITCYRIPVGPIVVHDAKRSEELVAGIHPLQVDTLRNHGGVARTGHDLAGDKNLNAKARRERIRCRDGGSNAWGGKTHRRYQQGSEEQRQRNEKGVSGVRSHHSSGRAGPGLNPCQDVRLQGHLREL